MFLHLSLLVLETPKGPKRKHFAIALRKSYQKGIGMSDSKTMATEEDTKLSHSPWRGVPLPLNFTTAQYQ